MEYGDEIEIEKPRFDKETGRWIFYSQDDDDYEPIEYEPVRMKVLERGNIHFLFHRIKVID